VGVKLDEVLPWGRAYSEYVRMFGLSALDLQEVILDVAGGPAAFNAEAAKLQMQVTSADPIYAFSSASIQARIDATATRIMDGVRAKPDDYNWNAYIPDPDSLYKLRTASMSIFLDDYPAGLEAGRYVNAQLPNLPFLANSYTLALCSHFLFLYSNVLSLEFHLASILEMLRVATEIRIFPLVDLDNQISAHLQPVIDQLEAAGNSCHIQKVDYAFHKKADQMLVVKRPA
jgi:hypothetical protein